MTTAANKLVTLEARIDARLAGRIDNGGFDGGDQDAVALIASGLATVALALLELHEVLTDLRVTAEWFQEQARR
jgi:ABC-type uncharacterized transport system ATPase component